MLLRTFYPVYSQMWTLKWNTLAKLCLYLQCCPPSSVHSPLQQWGPLGKRFLRCSVSSPTTQTPVSPRQEWNVSYSLWSPTTAKLCDELSFSALPRTVSFHLFQNGAILVRLPLMTIYVQRSKGHLLSCSSQVSSERAGWSVGVFHHLSLSLLTLGLSSAIENNMASSCFVLVM